MKTVEFERILVDFGFSLVSSGKHRKWSNGVNTVMIPHAREINRMIAKRILREIGYDKPVGQVRYAA